MKKIFFSIILVVVLILAIVLVGISDKNKKNNEISKFNAQFEKYNKETLYGTDILSIINKAIDNNEQYAIEKNQDGFYIENDTNSVKVEITLLTTDEDGKTKEVIHQMEELEKAGLDEFISIFNLTTFEFSKIEYNSQNRVSKIYVKQLEL